MIFSKAATIGSRITTRSTAIETRRCERIFADTPFCASRRIIKGAMHNDNLRDGGSIPLPRRAS